LSLLQTFLPGACCRLRRIYWGLFLTTLATLGFELLLTRLFSVVTWYHFALMAISIAMFGATAGAISVFLRPSAFTLEKTRRKMAVCALMFAATMIVALLVVAWTPFSAEATSGVGSARVTAWGVTKLALIYVVVSVPFFFSGIIVTLALTRFPDHVNRLYGVDLLGAALGCLALIVLLQATDGPTTGFAFSAMAALAGAFFSAAAAGRGLGALAMGVSVLLGVFTVGHGIAARKQHPMIRIRYSKGEREAPAMYEKWNAFSRIRVEGDPKELGPPTGWGMSSRYKGDPVHQLMLRIDGGAGTPLMEFNGDLGKLEYLKYDIINLAQYLRTGGNTAAIGAGGGRDLLSAMLFGQKHVTGIEINGSIIKAVTRIFGDFTGHLDRLSSATLVNDEARSYITRSRQKFDIIQISLIDTWAASSAGAYVLTENSLYTVEAWKTFLEHLTPGGILTVSRWYNKLGPTEAYRTVGLAAEALRQIGQQDPRSHILVARTVDDSPGKLGVCVGTVCVSNKPFAQEDVQKFEAVCKQMGFKLVLTPDFAEDAIFNSVSRGDFVSAARQTRLKITPPTDDSPFFFHFIKLRDVFRPSTWRNEFFTFNLRAVVVLGVLLLIVTVLTVACIFLPLWLAGRGSLEGWRPAVPLLYFASIGMGFMMVEISQMQRLIVFLGHPIYGLSVVLFVILSAAGVGSLAASKLQRGIGLVGTTVLILVALVAFGLAAPAVLQVFREASTPVRILTAALLLAPVAFCLGLAFPAGMRLAQARTPAATAWLWGVNGATSVLASVLAVALGIFAGITATFWIGAGFYLLAAMLCAVMSRQLLITGLTRP
jgi:hypothetical protein